MGGARRLVAAALAVAGTAFGGCTGSGGDRAGGGSTGGGTSAADASGSGGGGTGTTPDDFGPEQTYELRLNEDTPPPLTLDMNRDEVAQLFGDTADQVLLLELDTTALLTNTLDEIKNACGQSWMLDNPDPQHDCSLTPLGQTFMGSDGTWKTSPEYALVRVLTMTPANVDVEGTSSASLAGLADALNIGGGYGQILSDALGIPRTTPVVSTAALVQAFQDYFVSSHPAVGPGAKLDFYLSDALSDLDTLTKRYGPMGGHPGVIDPSFPVHGEVFGPDFQMKAVAESNLRVVDGLDGDQGKGFLSVIVDKTGPTYDDEAEFDFQDPAKFSLSGIVEDLKVDMRFKTSEYPSYVWSCLGDPPCQANLPGAPVDSSSVWALDPWELEQNVAAGAYDKYKDRTFDGSYLLGTAQVLIGQGGNPPGWIHYDVPFNIGSPPEDQYLWETILEVAQVALHHTPYNDFNEGDVNVAFTMHDLPIGLTGAQAAEAVRPYLQDQRSKLADFILGDYKKNNDHVDLYFRRGDDGELYLFFVGPTELQDGEPYTYENPGFFDSPDLSPASKVSDTDIPGLVDTAHEKLHVPVGETTVYFLDDGGNEWRIRVDRAAADSTSLSVYLAGKKG